MPIDACIYLKLLYFENKFCSADELRHCLDFSCGDRGATPILAGDIAG
jgi:hypothetical protein